MGLLIWVRFHLQQLRGVAVFITHLQSNLVPTFTRAGIVPLLGNESFYDDVASAMARIEALELAASTEGNSE